MASDTFITLSELLSDVPGIADKASQELQILTNSYGRLIAAVVVGPDLAAIQDSADALEQRGLTHGLGPTPYFVLSASAPHALEKLIKAALGSENAIVLNADESTERRLLALVPFITGVESVLLSLAIASGEITIPDESGPFYHLDEVEEEIRRRNTRDS